MDRRTFLSSLAALIAAGCARGSSPTGGAETNPNAPTSAGPAESVPSTSPTSSDLNIAESGENAESIDEAFWYDPPLDDALIAQFIGSGIFGFGVASGDPTADSVVLWTRLILDGPDIDLPLPDTIDVAWTLSATADMANPVASGTVTTSTAIGYSVHALAEHLPSNEVWYYRFTVAGHRSPIGRTRTLPLEAVSSPDHRPLRIGVSSCQLMETGHWSAHADIASRGLDLMLWLGDYIYEGGGWSHLQGRAHLGGEATTLEGYRQRYAQYRSEAVLQQAHGSCPWFIGWDDHEVVNDYTAAVDPERRDAAYQAWWEFMPTRLPRPVPDAPYRIYRSLDLGGYARIAVTDHRQYATSKSLLGPEQQQWLAESLHHEHPFTVLGFPTVASGIYTGGDPLLSYTLDGYPTERAWLGDHLAAAPGPVIVSGDLHAASAFTFSGDRRDRNAPVVATEFMAPPISSAFPAAYADAAPFLPLVNSHMEFFEIARGWLRLVITPERLGAEFRRVVDPDDPGSVVEPIRRYEVLPDRPGARAVR